MDPVVNRWLSMNRAQLDEIFKSCPESGTMPQGEMQGTAIIAGTPLSKVMAAFARLFAWQGKVFDIFADNGNSGVLVNKVSYFSLTFIVAKVYREKSWMDNREAIVIDYSKTSFFFAKVRDEIREVEPGKYLGKVWWGKTRILDFALTYKQ